MNKNGKYKSLMVINENSVFYKIKTFFKKLFYKSDIKQIEEIKKEESINFDNNNSQKKKAEFREKIEDKPVIDVFFLHKALQSGVITVKELSKEEKLKLVRFYEFEIEIKKQKIEKMEKTLIKSGYHITKKAT